ncbi:MAG: hypothetical protein N2491_09230 [Negativicutes bacterium]|nr:hypothetical protein [Negativicutes bacterium]
MKKIFIVIAALFLFSGVCAAGPLTDYAQGKSAIDITFNPQQDLEANGGKADGKSSNFDGSVTIGIGNKFAVQYRQMDTETDIDKLNAQEFNVLYKVNKHVSAFTGFAKTYYSVRGDNIEYKGPNNNHWQVGLIGHTPLFDKTTAYGIIAAGNDIRSWEVGVAYAFAKNVEFNVLYRDFKANNLAYPGENVDARVKGLGYGLTFKF